MARGSSGPWPGLTRHFIPISPPLIRPGAVVDLAHPLVLLFTITFLPHNLWLWIQIPLYIVFFKFFWTWCGYVAEMKKEAEKEEVYTDCRNVLSMSYVTCSTRLLSFLTLACAKEEKDIFCTSGRLSLWTRRLWSWTGRWRTRRRRTTLKGRPKGNAATFSGSANQCQHRPRQGLSPYSCFKAHQVYRTCESS